MAPERHMEFEGLARALKAAKIRNFLVQFPVFSRAQALGARAEKPRLAQMLLRSGSLAGVESIVLNYTRRTKYSSATCMLYF